MQLASSGHFYYYYILLICICKKSVKNTSWKRHSNCFKSCPCWHTLRCWSRHFAGATRSQHLAVVLDPRAHCPALLHQRYVCFWIYEASGLPAAPKPTASCTWKLQIVALCCHKCSKSLARSGNMTISSTLLSKWFHPIWLESEFYGLFHFHIYIYIFYSMQEYHSLVSPFLALDSFGFRPHASYSPITSITGSRYEALRFVSPSGKSKSGTRSRQNQRNPNLPLHIWLL